MTNAGLALSSVPVCFQDEEAAKEGEQEAEELPPNSPFNPDPNSMFLSPPREFVRPLVRAIRLNDEGDVDDAAELIGQFLADSGEEEFLVLTDKSKGTAVSVSKIATEMLGRMPKSAIDSYRVRFGVPARQRLSLAIADSNYAEISQVMQRFPYTDAGIEAAKLMGHHHFDAGRALLAAESFQLALEMEKLGGKSDPQLSVLTAVSWALAQRKELAETVMKNLASETGGKFRLGDEDITIDGEDPLAAIGSFIGSEPLASSSKVDQWLLVGGNASSKVTTTDGFPVGQPIWQVDVADSRSAQREIEDARTSIAKTISTSTAGSLVPANVPLIVDGLVMVGNEKQVSAVDFKTGKRLWAVASEADANEVIKQQQAGVKRMIVVQGRLQQSSSKTIDQAPWSDFLQGHASSDGKFIFHVVKSLAAPEGGSENNQIFRGRFESKKATTNTLQAIDVLNQGELAWEVGGGQTTGDPRLAEVSFLGAPLPIDGVLYAIGKHLQDIVLVALSSDDGQLVWMQALASSENSQINRYSSRNTEESHSMTPSYSKGILICPTGQNAMVAVDTIGRRIVWGSQTTGSETRRYAKRSGSIKDLQNPQVFVENSRVVAFDVSNETRLLAVSLLDGSPLMKIGKAGVKVKEVLYVASVDESQVVLVEKNRVRAISSDSGRKLWETSIRKFGSPTGRGYVSEKSFYLPTEGNAIVKIDLETGEVVDGVNTDHPLGNLIVHQGRVISRRETSVACYELDLNVMSELEEAAQAAGGIELVAPDLKIKQAALLRNRGEAKQAIELLQTIAEAERSGRFKSEFLQSATLLFESDPEFALTLFKEYESWFQFETNPDIFLGYVELLVKSGLKDDAMRKLLEDNAFFDEIDPDADPVLVQRPIAGYNVEPPADETQKKDNSQSSKNADDKKTSDNPPKDGKKAKVQKTLKEMSDPKKTVEKSADKKMTAFMKNQEKFNKSRISFEKNHWAKVQLIRIARNSPESIPQIRAAIERQISSAFVPDAIERHRLLRQFPLELVAPQSKFEVAEQLIAEDHVAEAENLLASLLGFLPTTAEQIESAEISADGLSKDSLVSLWSKIREAQYGAPAMIAAETEKSQTAKNLDYDRVDFKAVNAFGRTQRVYPTVIQPRGEVASRLFSGKRLSIWGGAQEFEVISPTGESETRFGMFDDDTNNRADLRRGSGWIQTNHSLAILRQKNLILALDLSKFDAGQEAVIWKKFVDPPLGWQPEIIDELDVIVNPSLRPEDVTASFPTSGCCCYIDKNNLNCVDAFTGAVLWSRTKDPSHGHVLANGDRVVTMDAKMNESSVFDLRTGERIATRTVSNLVQSMWEVDGVSFTAVGRVQQLDLDELTDFQDFRVVKEEAVEESESIEEPQPKEKQNPKDEPKSKEEKIKAQDAKRLQELKARKPLRKTRSKGMRLLARYDAEAGGFVWKIVVDDKALVSRLSGERFLVLSTDNQLHVFDSKTGKQLAKIPSGLTEGQRKKVRFFGGFEHLGQDLIVMANNKTIPLRENRYSIQATYSQGTFFSGHLISLSKDTLEPVWDHPAELDGFQLQPMLPPASPLLILNRRVQLNPASKRRPQLVRPGLVGISGTAMQVLALDLNDGHVAVNEILEPLGSVQFTPPIVDLKAGTIKMKLSGRRIEMTLEKSSDEPPSPVASVTKINPIPQTFKTPEAVGEVAAATEFDFEKVNERLVRQAEEYEADLDKKREAERSLLEKETSR